VIKTFDYLREYAQIKDDVLEAVARVFDSGSLLLGEETREFEEEFAIFAGAEYCVAVSSGTTALHIALLGLGVGPGSEVITVSNTCTPTISAIRMTGATPVFVDVCRGDLLIDPALVEAAISNKTQCILPVHLWGQAADVDALKAISDRTGIPIIEDCAQAHGALVGKKHVGTFGRAGCFSFYPTKNLGSYGDAGAIVTDDPEFADRLRRVRMYGYDTKGVAQVEGLNGRISEVQAAILRVKLARLDHSIARRRQLAGIYHRKITSEAIQTPQTRAGTRPSYHQYVIRTEARDSVIAALKAAEIGYGIHYDTPVHLMPAYDFLGGAELQLPVTTQASSKILSLPIHDGLEDHEVESVCEVINSVRA